MAAIGNGSGENENAPEVEGRSVGATNTGRRKNPENPKAGLQPLQLPEPLKPLLPGTIPSPPLPPSV